MIQKPFLKLEEAGAPADGNNNPADTLDRLKSSEGSEFDTPAPLPDGVQPPETKLDADGNPIVDTPPAETDAEKATREQAERDANDGKTLAELKEEKDLADANANKDFKPSEKWDLLKADEGFVMPEGLTKENEKELLREAVMKKYELTADELHPLVKEIQEITKTNPNITLQDIVASTQSNLIDLKDKTADEKIAIDMKLRHGTYDAEKNPEGVKDEDIKEFIDKLGKVEKLNLVKEIEINIEAYNQEMVNEYRTKNKEAFDKKYDEVVEINKKAITSIKENVEKLDTIYGIPVSPELIKNYLEEFERAITPDKATGERGIDKMLSDDIVLFKLWMLGAKNGEEKVIEEITKGREATKEKIFSLLGLTPVFSGHKENVGKSLSKEEEINLLKTPQQ